MIIKSKGVKSGGSASYGLLLSYITREQAVMKDKNGKPLLIKHNIQGKTLEDFKKQFIENEKNRRYNRSDKNYLLHEYMSLHPGDTEKLTPQILTDLVQHYLDLRAPNGMGIATLHDDKHHQHAHILLSSVELETGKALRLTKAQFVKVVEEMQRYQLEKYPELTASVIDLSKDGKQRETDNERQLKLRTGKRSRKEELKEILSTALGKSMTRNEFYENIKAEGLSLYTRGKNVGIEDNRNYRLATLGFGEEEMKELDLREERVGQLENLRIDMSQITPTFHASSPLSEDSVRQTAHDKEFKTSL